MEIIHEIKLPFPHLIVENMYNDEELELIWEELEFLNKNEKFGSPDEYGAAYCIQNKEKHYSTNAKALDLDSVYSNRKYSNILNVNRKIFNYNKIYSNLSPYYIKFALSNYDNTKIRYYRDGEYYSPHRDTEFDTLACTYFYKSPKKFTGGELFFPEYDYEVECKNNLCIIFPAYFVHEVKKIYISDNNYNFGFGRYCMSQFVNCIRLEKK
jgi:Rps23 Pro-64 3,4-dihydroxylase Tpa1-like proline 4-hydroxylase